LVLFFSIGLIETQAAGLLKPIGGGDSNVHMKSHRVSVIINNGFARTEVDQVFMNTSDKDLEAVYSFPLPRYASLSELSLWIDGSEVIGEVLEKQQARDIYEDQLSKGNETALAHKHDYKTFDINVYPVSAQAETRVRLVYYQPVEIDLNVGRYVYPMAEGGVDEKRIAFWSVDNKVHETFSCSICLKSAFPVKDIRLPEFHDQAVIQKRSGADSEGGDEVYDISLDMPQGTSLDQDVVMYYRLDDTTPARVELLPYKEPGSAEGTFMVVVTPGGSLHPIKDGSDWIFILDTSGSMNGGKITSLAEGVSRVIGKLSPQDRFRVIAFNSNAKDITKGYLHATPDNVQHVISRVKALQASGSTNLFDGLEAAYTDLDRERTTGIILVTDGVANEGCFRHNEIVDLVKRYDVRVFTFVMGNSANQPLMESIARCSGGFAMNISDNDDIIGRILQAKAMVTHECLYDTRLSFNGLNIKDLSPAGSANLYVGRQLVMFGRYTGSGEVDIEFAGRIGGEDKGWRCSCMLPETDMENPEIERLWALSRIEEAMGAIREKGKTRDLYSQVVGLGTQYSLVTDYTSMVVLKASEMENMGIDSKNAHRVKKERKAQAKRSSHTTKNYRVDNHSGSDSSSNTGMFNGHTSHNIGTGAVGPLFVTLVWWLRRKCAAK